MVLQTLTPNKIIKEIPFEKYVPKKSECEDITKSCKDVFVAQIEKTDKREEQIEKALHFIKTLWIKYDCEQVANIYDKFVKMEEALFGLKRQEESGKYYRDHFVHMFNCFVFGLRIISSILKQVPTPTSKNLFKVEDESLKKVGLPFGSDYKYDQRLFYLWTLVSTFHDIAIPFQELASLGKGISRFVEEFGWVFTDPQISMHNFDSSQLYYYFNLISSLYSGQLKLIEDGRKYDRPENQPYYLTKLLGREFDRRNHGVLSGFFMWKTIEEIFLVSRSKYKFNIDQFNRYTEYVLEQDVARAALDISLHGIDKDKKSDEDPKIFPISFTSYPLAFLIILSDELQEYLRWEGMSLKKQLGAFNYHPLLDIKFDKSNNTICIKVCFSLNSSEKDTIIERVSHIARFSGNDISISKIDEAITQLGNLIKKNLERKLEIGKSFKIELNIYKDWKKKCYSENLISSI